MSGLFGSTPKPPPPPKPIRMPRPDDPNARKAARLAKGNRRKAQGRRSTIMTQQNSDASGSVSQTLGAGSN